MLSVIFALAGLGAALAGINSGHQTTPRTGQDGLILLTLGVVYVFVGVCLWIEFLWAWWAGLDLASVVVIADLVLGIHDGGLVVWSAFLALFAASAVQGRHEETR